MLPVNTTLMPGDDCPYAHLNVKTCFIQEKEYILDSKPAALEGSTEESTPPTTELRKFITIYWNTTEADPALLRDSEKEIAALDTPEYATYLAVYDLREQVRLQAILGVATTILVCAVLGVGAMIFSKITTDLVISPIEDMVSRVNNITRDPLKAAHEEEERLLFEELAEKEAATKAMQTFDAKDGIDGKKHEKEGPLETAMLERTLTKIGALLALGFGEAGSKIIAQNMAKGDDVNPMLPGQKIMCIFGFCDIRNFTDATEVLQEGVMLFVNEIGEICHSIVDRYSGAANKNIGDAFLMVWKFFDPEEIIELAKTGHFDNRKVCKENIIIADMAVFSTLKTIAKINKYD
mmetsp:Transcript_32582/g.49821  ORF Transcript_32582/g.49821 Transcript_32582/m.49821 type:complete len:350 (+) Transcript_32582:1594-2643(+)